MVDFFFGKRVSKEYSITNLQDFVKLLVEDEIVECKLQKSKALLLDIQDDLIHYLITEFPKVQPGDLVNHVCGFTNLDAKLLPKFTKCFYFMEQISQILEEQRNRIMTEQERRKLEETFKRLVKNHSAKNPPPPPQPQPPVHATPVDPRPRPVNFRAPPSELSLYDKPMSNSEDEDDVQTNSAASAPNHVFGNGNRLRNEPSEERIPNARFTSPPFSENPVSADEDGEYIETRPRPSSVYAKRYSRGDDNMNGNHTSMDSSSLRRVQHPEYNITERGVSASPESDEDRSRLRRARPTSHYTKHIDTAPPNAKRSRLHPAETNLNLQKRRPESSASDLRPPSKYSNVSASRNGVDFKHNSHFDELSYRNSPVTQASTQDEFDDASEEEEETFVRRRARSPSHYNKNTRNDKIKRTNAPFNDAVVADRSHSDDLSHRRSPTSHQVASSSKTGKSKTPPQKLRNDFNTDGVALEKAPAKKKIKFAVQMSDNEGKTAQNELLTRALPLNPDHNAIDQKVAVITDSQHDSRSAFPNQAVVVATPYRIPYDNWPAEDEDDFKEKIQEVLHSFRCNDYTGPSAEKFRHLFITDSLLGPIKLQDKYKQVNHIYARYPNKLSPIIDILENEIDIEQNDYAITNVFVAVGFDVLCYEPSFDKASEIVLQFLDDLAVLLRQAFDKNGPKRIKDMNPLDDGTFPDTWYIPELPRLIISTIPYIESHPVALTHKEDIIKLNKLLCRFVAVKKDGWFRKHNQRIEIYDFEAKTANFRQCSRLGMEERYRVLTTDLANDYLMFMRQ